MNCPECNGKTTVNDYVKMEDENYRKRICVCCGHTFFTTEFEVENNEKFKNAWRRYHRRNKRRN